MTALTRRQALARAIAALAESPTARLDAEVLLMHAEGTTRAMLLARGDEAIETDALARFDALVARRRAGEPVAYLIGQREFWSLPLHVSPAVLIPRPDTELLVERALALLSPDAAATLADIGTGSGAVALALARERPACRVIASDISPAALDVARRNASALGIENVEFVHCDLLPDDDRRFDLIVSNPPYVRADDPHLSQGDLRFEPRAALVGGADGLDVIRRIAAASATRLRPGGWLVLEHGHDQAHALAQILHPQGYVEIRNFRDLGDRPRVTQARLAGAL